VLVAACAAVKTEPNESTATAAIKMLKVRIKFLQCSERSIAQSTPNVSRSSRALPANVRFGPIADILQCDSHMRFTPESGHVRCN
jgi:hypothetical protein